MRQAAKLQPKAQLYVCVHMVYPCVIFDLRAALSCQDSDSIFHTIEINRIYILEILLLEWLPAYYFVSSAVPVGRWTQRGPGGGGVLLVKTDWVFIQNVGYEIKQHFVIQGPKLLRYSGSGISLKSEIPSFQCEVTNKAEHIRPLQKVNSLLHISKYLK